MNKIAFTFIATTILLLTSFIPVAEKVVAEKSNETKKIVVPVQIYTLQGVKEIKKELPLKEATKLKEKAYEAAKAIETLHKNASLIEKIKANEIIDSFLYEMKKNGLLGEMNIEEAKELITGKYLEKQKNIEMKKLKAIANLFQKNGWEVNAMCGCAMLGNIIDRFPWNRPINFFVDFLGYLADYLYFHNHTTLSWIVEGILLLILICAWWVPDAIPHPTTIGYWLLYSYGWYPQPPEIYTIGLLGYKKLGGYELRAITFGFTGVVISAPLGRMVVGFCPFIAMKRVR